MTILVLDDDWGVVCALTRVLTRAGHRVLGFSDYRAAIAELTATHVDVAVVDLHLGSISGQVVVREILATKPDTRTIILSGDDVEVPGPSLILQKPIASTVLLAAVNESIPTPRLPVEFLKP